MINETFEQAAERFYPISKGGSMWMPSAGDCNKANKQEGFIQGAKWQAEQSEHKISEAYERGLNTLIPLIENLNKEITELKRKGI